MPAGQNHTITEYKKVPSIYLESRHDLQKKGGLLDIKSGLEFRPQLLFRTFIATIKIFNNLGSR
jgi:hypothetical protein